MSAQIIGRLNTISKRTVVLSVPSANKSSASLGSCASCDSVDGPASFHSSVCTPSSRVITVEGGFWALFFAVRILRLPEVDPDNWLAILRTEEEMKVFLHSDLISNPFTFLSSALAWQVIVLNHLIPWNSHTGWVGRLLRGTESVGIFRVARLAWLWIRTRIAKHDQFARRRVWNVAGKA